VAPVPDGMDRDSPGSASGPRPVAGPGGASAGDRTGPAAGAHPDRPRRRPGTVGHLRRKSFKIE